MSKRSASQSEWYYANRERIRAHQKAYRKGVRPKKAKKVYKSSYYATHRKEILAEMRARNAVRRGIPLPPEFQPKPKPDHDRWLRWRLSHLRACEDYPGSCCKKCHRQPVLWFVSLPNDNVAYLCCGKRIESRVGYSGTTNADYDAMRRHGVNRFPAPTHDAAEIAKLPDGLLKSWLESKL